MAPVCRAAGGKCSPRRAHEHRDLGIVRSVMVELNRSEGAALTVVPSGFYDVVTDGKRCQTYSEVKARGHPLEAILVAKAVQADIATFEMVAYIRELLLQLRFALAYLGELEGSLRLNFADTHKQ